MSLPASFFVTVAVLAAVAIAIPKLIANAELAILLCFALGFFVGPVLQNFFHKQKD